MKAATSGYPATGDFLQCIYSLFVVENHQKFRSGCLVHEFPFKCIFKDINHGYRTAILRKTFLGCLATYCNYEKVRRMMIPTNV